MGSGKTIFILLCSVILAYTHAVAASGQPTAVLSLEPAVTLPGIPVAFMVTIDNPSGDSIMFANAARLRVTTATGAFDARGIKYDQVELPINDVTPCGDAKCVIIPPHGRKQIYFNYGAILSENEFFYDDRLSDPGTFQLQLFLYVDNDGSFSEVPSNTAKLVVQQPSGVDAAVWALLKQRSPTRRVSVMQWLTGGYTIADQIRRDFPTSAYVPYLAAYGAPGSDDKSLSLIDSALSQNPTPSLRDNLLLTKAAFLAYLSGGALHSDRNVDAAMQFANEARAAYETLRKVAISDVIRQQASDALTKLLTEGSALEDLRLLAAGDPPAPARVVPKVECVSRGQGEAFSVRFGYVNPNDSFKVLQLSDNQITPAPRDQGQPRIFGPGTHTNVFVAKSPGGVLKWRLDGNEAVATADSAPPCESSVAAVAAVPHR